MASLEKASVEENIEPFANFLMEEIEYWKKEIEEVRKKLKVT